MTAPKFRFSRVLAMARKEVFHITRDPFTMALALVLPAIVVVIFGVAIEFNLTSIPTGVMDFDRTPGSHRLVQTFGSSDYFRLRPVRSPAEGFQLMESEEVRALVVIPASFEKDMITDKTAQVQILVDAADNSATGSILGYLGEIKQRASRDILQEWPKPPLQLKTRFLFNPELNSKWFAVPGLAVVVMAILSILLTALTVAREWESGSMELLLATPVQPLEVILGKLSPYGVLCMIAVGIVYVLARLVFSVPFVGNHLVFLFGCFLFLVTYLAQGLLISVITRKQTIAMQFAMIAGMLPSQLLSGFIFPVESMPKFFQYFTMILPARWFMEIARASFLQGSSLWELRRPLFALALIGLVMIALAVKRFKRDVEP